MEENKEFIRCKRCNRPLRSKKARNRGYGNQCWLLYQAEIKPKKKYPLFEELNDKEQ